MQRIETIQKIIESGVVTVIRAESKEEGIKAFRNEGGSYNEKSQKILKRRIIAQPLVELSLYYFTI